MSFSEDQILKEINTRVYNYILTQNCAVLHEFVVKMGNVQQVITEARDVIDKHFKEALSQIRVTQTDITKIAQKAVEVGLKKDAFLEKVVEENSSIFITQLELALKSDIDTSKFSALEKAALTTAVEKAKNYDSLSIAFFALQDKIHPKKAELSLVKSDIKVEQMVYAKSKRPDLTLGIKNEVLLEKNQQLKLNADAAEQSANIYLGLFILGAICDGIYTAIVFDPVLLLTPIYPLIIAAATFAILGVAAFYLVTKYLAESEIASNNATINANKAQMASESAQESAYQTKISDLTARKDGLENAIKVDETLLAEYKEQKKSVLMEIRSLKIQPRVADIGIFSTNKNTTKADDNQEVSDQATTARPNRRSC